VCVATRALIVFNLLHETCGKQNIVVLFARIQRVFLADAVRTAALKTGQCNLDMLATSQATWQVAIS